MNLPVLYSFRRCPYAMRARLALLVSKQQVELREIVLRDKPAEMIDASPKATVPVLVLPDGQVIDESFDVMTWALTENDPTGLMRLDFDAQQKLVHRCDHEFKPYLDRYKYPNKFEDCDRPTAIAKASVFLNELDDLLAGKSFLFGSTRGFADIGIAPFVRQFAHVDREWFLKQDWENLIAWYLDFTQSDDFGSIMVKLPRWQAGGNVTLFP